MTPSVDEIRRSVDAIDLAMSGLIRFAEEGEIRHWYKATGLLQDALAELGYDITPVKQQPKSADYAVKCVGAHDLCYLGGPCQYCEREMPLRDASTGRFAPATPEAIYDDAAYFEGRQR